jgi:hypothetical protein
MCREHFCRGFASEALSRLIVEMAGKVGQVALRDGCKIGITWHEAANALVGIFHGTFLPGRAGIAEQLPAPMPSSKALKPANSVPRSKVKLWRAKAGKGENVPMILSMIGRECRLWFLIITV